MRTWLKGTAGLAMAALLLGACASAKSETKVTGVANDTPAETPAEPVVVPTHSTVATELGGNQYLLEVLRGSAEAGALKLSLVNAGKLDHEVSLVRLNDGDYDGFVRRLRTDGAAALAGLTVAGTAGPVGASETDSATVQVTAGVYAIVDTGVGPDGKLYGQNGMVAQLLVEPGAEAAAAAAGAADAGAASTTTVAP